jgi:hypothetical protein
MRRECAEVVLDDCAAENNSSKNADESCFQSLSSSSLTITLLPLRPILGMMDDPARTTRDLVELHTDLSLVSVATDYVSIAAISYLRDNSRDQHQHSCRDVESEEAANQEASTGSKDPAKKRRCTLPPSDAQPAPQPILTQITEGPMQKDGRGPSALPDRG